MRYLLYFVLFIIGGLAYSNPIFKPVFFIFSTIFFIYVYKNLINEKINKSTIYLILMAYSLPFSWRSVLGGDYSSLPISWFYVFGGLYVVTVLTLKDKKLNEKILAIFIISLLTLLISFIPLLNSNSNYMGQAITQFIILTFNNILILFSLFKYNTLTDEDIVLVKKVYILGALFTSIMLIIQYIVFKNWGFEFGFINFMQNRMLLYFLFSDISHGTLYLSTAAFWVLYSTKRNEKNFKNYLIFLLICLGSAITSARTGLFILAVFTVLFILFGQKNFIKKISLAMFFIIVAYFSFNFLQNVRQLDSVSQLTNSSGRIEGYKVALDLLFESPWIGYGYSRDYLSNVLKDAIPHLSILQYALHGGILFSLSLFFNQIIILSDGVRKKTVFPWLLLMVLVGTCLIPDLFATRYITLLCVLSISSKKCVD